MYIYRVNPAALSYSFSPSLGESRAKFITSMAIHTVAAPPSIVVK